MHINEYKTQFLLQNLVLSALKKTADELSKESDEDIGSSFIESVSKNILDGLGYIFEASSSTQSRAIRLQSDNDTTISFEEIEETAKKVSLIICHFA